MASWHIDIFNKCPDLRNLVIYAQENVKYQHSAIVLYVFYLSSENKMCSSAKLGVGLCISSYKTKYLG